MSALTASLRHYYPRKYWTLIRRDLLEHRTAFLTVPVILTAIFIALLVSSLLFGEIDAINPDVFVDGEANFGNFMALLAQETDKIQGLFVALLMTTLLTFLSLILPFIIFFTLLGSLYEERRDRSFLFWKSMPVSDWEEVVARLFGGTWIPTISYTVIGLAGCLILLVLASLISLAQGGPIGPLWHLGASMHALIVSIPVGLVWFLWLLPIFAWIMLASAAAPRAPLMVAVLPPAVLILGEGLVFGSWSIARTFGHQAWPISSEVYENAYASSFAAGFRDGYAGKEPTPPSGMEMDGPALSAGLAFDDDPIAAMWAVNDAFLTTFGDVQLYIGLLLGIGFLALAVWRRRFTS